MNGSVKPVSVSLDNERQKARIDLAAAFRQAVLDDLHEGISNHFTLNVPSSPGRFLLNNYGLHWTEVKASNLLEVTYEGHTDEGFADQTAVCIHAPIHRLVPDAECIMHTHMPFCTALSQLEDMTLEMTGQTAIYFHNKIAYDYHYNGFADDMAEGERLANIMGGKPILMLANHGVVVTGKNVASAYYRLYYLERACRTQLYSMWTGRPRRTIEMQIIEKLTSQTVAPSVSDRRPFADYMFDAIKRGLDRTQADYAH